MGIRHPLLALIAALAAGSATAQAPLSAIDWLSQTPTVALDVAPFVEEPPIDQGVTTPEVTVSPLGNVGRDAVGLLPSSVTGLPSALWSESPAQTLADRITDLRVEGSPAMQALLYTLLLAEANPPQDAGQADALLLARVDKLVALGAIEQANALLERAGPNTETLFQRWFDVTLLLGEEQRACEALNPAPHLSPSYAARVFCLARAGDWTAAALTLETANLLGLLTLEEDALLLRFLDPEISEGEPLLVTPNDPTPLTFRLYEAIGEPLPTTSLPRPFAHADLRSTSGWKAQLEAAERLASVGALPENRLLGIYTERQPAASGMIWDRVDALQAFDEAVEAGDRTAVEETLAAAWSAAQQARVEVPFSRIYGPVLADLSLTGVAQVLAREVQLLSPAYEVAAQSGPRDFLAGLARGSPPRRGQTPEEQAVAEAFNGAGVPQSFSHKLARGQLGEVILAAMALYEQGLSGDLRALTESLATFRALGLEDTARQAALQVLLLDRRT
ncbi:hypothetical protein [Cognatishimia activa]|uniref:Uncharacterized protein n=1 Tax=Cognatishimia activa TaxID=1715691 RepID=A0A975EPK2_9RHOB|nr:hypothetical protein [Cognatishimia activa]QTN35823.1 hypothetical protein HZ995_15360 [Cognatishimia activa]